MKVSTYIFKFVSDGLELKHEQILSNEQSLDPVEKCLQVIQNIDVLMSWNIDVLENIPKINAISVVILE